MNVVSIIQSVVANRYDISVVELISMRRAIRLVLPRHMSIAIAKRMTDKTFTAIGHAFGDRDRATIIYAVEKIETQARSDSFLREELSLIEQQVRLAAGMPENFIVSELVEVPVPSPVYSETCAVVAAFCQFENDQFTRGEASARRNLERALCALRTAHQKSTFKWRRTGHEH